MTTDHGLAAGGPRIRNLSGGSSSSRSTSLADVLDRVLDKGIVIVGDVVVSVLDVELLTLKLRLFIASADTAHQLGMDWWTTDPFYSSGARALEQENRELRDRLAALEDAVGARSPELADRAPERVGQPAERLAVDRAARPDPVDASARTARASRPDETGDRDRR